MTSDKELGDWCAVGAGGLMKPEDVTEEVLEAERSVLLRAKQTRMEEVFERHDNMVRVNCFHLFSTIFIAA
jgi:helicase SWR1